MQAEAPLVSRSSVRPGRGVSGRSAVAICHKYNKDECTGGPACKFRHMCSTCGGGHPAAKCKKSRSEKEHDKGDQAEKK